LHIGATANGVYGVKLFAEQFGRVSKLVRWTELLPDLRFVYLIRADVLGQAISWARAIQTAQWRSTMQATCLPVYDANLIRAQLLAILRERAEWEAYFARTRIDPLHVIYEQFVEDPIGHVDRIAALMEIDHPTVDPQRVDLVVQRDSLSDEWRWCFQKQCGDRNVFDAI
jgi:LPS sulfotransferase NodH